MAGADEGLYFQVLLDPLKEQFHLPTRLVKAGDRLGRQFQMIGQENAMLAGLGIAAADTTQWNGALSGCFGAGEHDALVAG